MRKTYLGIPTAVLLGFLSLLAFSCKSSPENPARESSPTAPPGITLSITNGQPEAPLELVAGQEYVFDRITLQVENRTVSDSPQALDWLKNQSSFQNLNWQGAREIRAHWRNYKASRPAADLFSHVFEGAPWMAEPNSLELSVLDEQGSVLGEPFHLSHHDFLNHLKQWDFDMIKAEFRWEDFARHKDKSSARVKRAVAKIVFAIQTNPTKRLRVPAGAHSLRVVWDKKPQEPYLFPIRLLDSPYPYGLQIQAQVEPQKDLYMPGEKLRATFRLLDRSGNILKLSEFAENGITRLYVHLDGPRHDPTFYHEEWLNDFRGNRFAHILRSPARGLGTADESLSTPRNEPPLDPTGTSLVVDLHVPDNLPRDAYGTFEIRAAAGRAYASQIVEIRLALPIPVGQSEKTEFERFGCKSCHIPDTPMDVGLLLPPMGVATRLSLDDFQECVMCHDNSRGGSRRLDKYLHLIHMNRDTFPVPKNNCVVCHMTAASIQKVSWEVCSNCHESLHDNNRDGYTDAQCRACHTDYGRGHIVPQ